MKTGKSLYLRIIKNFVSKMIKKKKMKKIFFCDVPLQVLVRYYYFLW